MTSVVDLPHKTAFVWRSREQSEDLGAMSDAVMRLKIAYNENDITIPFPIGTLDFGIKGGQPLSGALDSRDRARAVRDSE